MDLPNEIISIIFKHLYLIDRLRARVNQRLYLVSKCRSIHKLQYLAEIESSNRYCIDELIIINRYKNHKINIIDLKRLKNPGRYDEVLYHSRNIFLIKRYHATECRVDIVHRHTSEAIYQRYYKQDKLHCTSHFMVFTYICFSMK